MWNAWKKRQIHRGLGFEAKMAGEYKMDLKDKRLRA
jgi:hypothetical protein